MPRIEKSFTSPKTTLVLGNDVGVHDDAQPPLVHLDDRVAMRPARRNGVPVALEAHFGELVDPCVTGHAWARQHCWKCWQHPLLACKAITNRLVMGRMLAGQHGTRNIRAQPPVASDPARQSVRACVLSTFP